MAAGEWLRNCIVKPRGVGLYGLASAYSVRALRVGQYARYNYFVDKSSSGRLVVSILPLAPKLYFVVEF